MKASIQQKLLSLKDRLGELDKQLSSETVTASMDNYRKLTKEHADISPVVSLFRDFQTVEADMAAAQDMASDPDMRDYAEAEIKSGKEKLLSLEKDLQTLLLPKDPNDERNIFLEIRAGTGGDESALFSGDLFRMYARYAERNRWQVEIISESLGEVGGYKEVIAKIIGQGAYSKLKFESGGHRVQRVPDTETQGRIHTSACTVAILPEVDDVSDVVINPSEIRIDTFRASGAGGQHVNKTDSAIRITHLPTGLVAECQDDRSQHRNKAKALAVLPEPDELDAIKINPSDLRIDTYRASGAGGQHINKTDSAVRLTHLPTGIVVQCQDGRSQHGNRDVAWKRLRSRLYDFELRKQQEAQQKLEDTKTDVGWGHQIRSYVLDNSRIKDLRTNYETSATQKVLDGDLDQFIEASLKQGV